VRRPGILDREEIVDRQLKKLMKDLGDAINHSMTESEQIAAVITRIKSNGYDIYLVLEATVGFTKQGEARSPRSGKSPSGRALPGRMVSGRALPGRVVSGRAKMPEFKLNTQDRQFLKALHIRLDDAA
jgi:hypothetical protein